jgi:hypothetical protein
MQLNCRNCSKTTALASSGYYADGSQALLASCCGKDGGVLHRCSHSSPLAQPEWLPLLVAGIEIVCPQCKQAYDLGVKIAPVNPEAGEGLQAAALIVGGFILIRVIAEFLQGRQGGRRRR